MPATVGAQLASADRRVIGIIGDGSANYGITALWTAARYRIPATFLVLKNGVYGALQSFSTLLGVAQVPGIDIPGIDFCALASGYGVASRRADTADALAAALAEAMAGDAPMLIEVPVSAPNDR
jgi:benzoylformate decarboxylase